MKTNGFTPGPWKIAGTSDGIRYIHAPAGQYADGEERTLMVAEMHFHRPGAADRLPFQEIREANAFLIAAAPDLLEALKEALYAMETANRQYEIDKGQRSTIIDSRIDRAKAAIEAATHALP